MMKSVTILFFLSLVAMALADCPCTCHEDQDESKAAAECALPKNKMCHVFSCEEQEDSSMGKTCCTISVSTSGKKAVTDATKLDTKEEFFTEVSGKNVLPTTSRGICRRLVYRVRCVCYYGRCYCYRYYYYYYYYC